MPATPDAHAIQDLKLTIAYNKTDATFGWNGFNSGLTLYYISQGEEYVSGDHSYPLVDGLSPSVTFSLVQTKYLGKPFTG